jgi:cytochrome b561
MRYGAISRFLHWAMALVFLWQFATALSHLLLDDTPVEALLWPTHKSTGFLLLTLVILRAAWALANRGGRPPSIDLKSRVGHLALYALMIVTPLLGLLRQYGDGRSFAPFGLPVLSGFEGDEISWLVVPGNLLHSWLGWALLALIVGHVAMVIVHRRGTPDKNVLPRMAGSRRP